MDLDNLIQQWNKIDIKIDDLERQNRQITNLLCRSNAKTSLQQLADKYFNLAFVGIALTPLAVVLKLVTPEFPLWVCIIYALFGAIQASAFFYFSSYIRKTNLMTLPITECVTKVLKIRKYQKLAILYSFMLALPVLIPLFYYFWVIGDEGMVFAAIIGGVIGLIIGIRKDIQLFRLSKKILSDLQDFVE